MESKTLVGFVGIGPRRDHRGNGGTGFAELLAEGSRVANRADQRSRGTARCRKRRAAARRSAAGPALFSGSLRLVGTRRRLQRGRAGSVAQYQAAAGAGGTQR